MTMDQQLRRTGGWIRRLMSSPDERRLRRIASLVDAVVPLARLGVSRTMRVRRFRIERGDGTRLRILVYSPRQPVSDATGVLWLHGGGYFLGRPEQDVAVYRRMVRETGCVILAPDYRRSVDEPYPAALDDCYTALIWMRDNASGLGLRLDQLVVAGESAGGGLTAALTLLARDRGEVNIAFQMPIYPMIDDRVCTASSRDNDAPLLDTATLVAAWKMYLRDLHGTQRVPIYAAPARAVDLRGLPPTFTYVGELEPFRDETLAYVDGLRACGVPVDFEIYPGCWHGFDRLVPRAEVSRRALRSRERWFRHAAATYFAPQPDQDRNRA
ncbi:alpha/beta hydrolase [Nocardia jejuensis]|uniref:alpha/beta hydrolase n=1 Tax=Nocardia jejuensis TaxID=328049 RepID=UPI001C3FA10E|nr:alpha/beta hydrolase [Nocardia jejuensis]